MKRELGFPGDRRCAVDDERIETFGRSQGTNPNLAVLQYFGMPETDGCPSRSGPDTDLSLTQPTKFWPKSRIVLPDGDVRIARTGSSCVCRIGGPSGAVRRVMQPSEPV